MKLEKAIEILEKDVRGELYPDDPDLQDAERLGIEALKRIHSNRNYGPIAGTGLLPGETED